ncbi:MAG: AAA family ATPase [Planctomycetota bacterium]|nr:AAA family ATPase [Planctomycetota bacterium]
MADPSPIKPAAPIDPARASAMPGMQDLPAWAGDLIELYESGATSQFVLYGNVDDRMVLPLGGKAVLGSLTDFLLKVLLPRFDVILSYDIGNGIRVEKGGEIFTQWPHFKENNELPKAPRQAVDTLTHYFRYVANLGRLKGGRSQVACVIKAAHLVAPMFQGGLSYDLNAMALLIREWAADSLLSEHSLATFLIAENLNDLHPLIVNNPRASSLKIPLPPPTELQRGFAIMQPQYGTALKAYGGAFEAPAAQLAGATLSSIESLLKTKEYGKESLAPGDLVQLKKQLVEKDCNGLIDFIESSKSLDDLYGQEKIKAWLRQDIALWQKNDLQALPMGYLLCGPVGTGKTYMVECLAGEAAVPVVKLKNFRDKWVGSSEGNLEKIFRLLSALGRCLVFIDEADQALGRRDGGGSDSGVGGRIYSMMAEEMSKTSNRGKIMWVLASSRPDLIEVDLKRPGRVDVKIPLFPTTTADEGFRLIRALCKKRGVAIDEKEFANLEPMIPNLLTPGAAEALSVKIYRQVRTSGQAPLDALKECLTDYQNPVPREVLEFQIRIAVQEASDLEFVPPALRKPKVV